MHTYKAKMSDYLSNLNATEGRLNVLDGDMSLPPLDALFAQSVSDFTLASSATASGVNTFVDTFTATGAHGIATGSEVLLLDTAADKSFYAEVLSQASNVITVDRPIDHSFDVATTLGRVVTTEMAVNGAVTRQAFSIRAGSIPIDHTRFIITIRDDNSMDDSKFGGITALTRGLVFRIVNSFQKTIFCFKSNQEIKQFCYDVQYSDKAPAGEFGMSARISFAGKDKHGTALRIQDDDVIQWVVQDDLTGITSMKISAQGHDTED